MLKQNLSLWKRFWNLPWYTKAEIMVFPNIAFNYYIATLGFPAIASPIAVLEGIVRVAVVICMALGILMFKLGFRDFRFKASLHILIVGFIGVSTATILETPEGEFIPLNILPLFILIVVINFFIGMSAFFSVFDIIMPLSNNLDTLKQRLETGDISARIDDPHILKDQILGKIANIINEVLDINSSLAQIAIRTNQIIIETVESLRSNAEELSASVEEVSSSTQNMAQGA